MTRHWNDSGGASDPPIDSIQTGGYQFEDIPASENLNWIFRELSPYRQIDKLEDVALISKPGQLFISDSPVEPLPLKLKSSLVIGGTVDAIAVTSESVLIVSFAVDATTIYEYSRNLATLLRTYTTVTAATAAFSGLVTNGRYIAVSYGSRITIFDRDDLVDGDPKEQTVGGVVADLAISGDKVFATHMLFASKSIASVILSTAAIFGSGLVGNFPVQVAYGGGVLIAVDPPGGIIYYLDPETATLSTITSWSYAGTLATAAGTVKTDGKIVLVAGDTGAAGLVQERGSVDAAEFLRDFGTASGTAAWLAIDEDYIFVARGAEIHALHRQYGSTFSRPSVGATITSIQTDGQHVYIAHGNTIERRSRGGIVQRFKRVDPTDTGNHYPLLMQPLGE